MPVDEVVKILNELKGIGGIYGIHIRLEQVGAYTICNINVSKSDEIAKEIEEED